MSVAMELVDYDMMDVDDAEPFSGFTSVDTIPSLGGRKVSLDDRDLVVDERINHTQSSLLEGALDSYTMDIILSYLTLIEYSRLSVASRIMKDTVSRSTHLRMNEYSLFRKKSIQSVRAKEISLEPTEMELLPYCDVTPQKELQSLMHRFNNVRVLNLQGLAPVGDDLIDHALPLVGAADVEMEVAGPLAELGGGLPAEVVEHIGEGRCCLVYSAKSIRDSHTKVALKVMRINVF